MNKKNMQSFEWGYIEWIYEPEPMNSLNVMNIGIATILPGKRQNRHIHYGDEQLIYVLSGKGEQRIGDRINIIKPGSIHHIEAGSIHETINIGEKSINELIISIPVYSKENLFIYNKEQDMFDDEKIHHEVMEINSEIEYIYETIMESLKMPVTIFNREEKVIIKGKDYPEFCKMTCRVDKHIENCPIYKIKDKYDPPQYTDSSAFVCPYGLTVFTVPIVDNYTAVGFIKGGHIKTSESLYKISKIAPLQENMDVSFLESIEMVPKSRVKAILHIMKQLSKNIVNYYAFKNTTIELSKKEKIIKDIVQNEIMLEESLKSAQDKVLSIQMNNHFLFNTLNAIASLALKENSLKTYNAIVDLSKMFRYSLKNNSYFVQLKDEIEYIKNYLNLQKLRYGERLLVDFNISMDAENRNLPFNCMQPIIENCFKHGFEDVKNEMRIKISARIDDKNLVIKVCDNGLGMTGDNLNVLQYKIKEHNKHQLSGLMMVYAKLELFYSNNFNFEISSIIGKGTHVEIVLPDKMMMT